jgi:hypothetical protein
MEGLSFLNKMQKDFDNGLKESFAMFDKTIKDIPEEHQGPLIDFKNKLIKIGQNPTAGSADGLTDELKGILKDINNA